MNKLTKPAPDVYEKTKNELSQRAILECASGENKGKTRVISAVYDRFKLEPIGPKESASVYIVGDNVSGVYELDPGTKVKYDYNMGKLSFSSNKVQYIIRAIQDTDEVFGYPPSLEPKGSNA